MNCLVYVNQFVACYHTSFIWAIRICASNTMTKTDTVRKVFKTEKCTYKKIYKCKLRRPKFIKIKLKKTIYIVNSYVI